MMTENGSQNKEWEKTGRLSKQSTQESESSGACKFSKRKNQMHM